jgi:hypothetical protein
MAIWSEISRYLFIPDFNIIRNMIITLIIVYILLAYIIGVDKEYLYKAMIFACIVTVSPLIILGIYSIISGSTNLITISIFFLL